MTTIPTTMPQPGRLFPVWCNHNDVARWLRAQAKRGFQRDNSSATRHYVESCACGVNLHPKPNSISLILSRDRIRDYTMGWHLSVCCVTDTGYRGYVPAEGEYWLNKIFRRYAIFAVLQPLENSSPLGAVKDLRHWIIPCNWDDPSSPIANLDGLDEIARPQ